MVSLSHSCFLIGVICSVSRMTCATKVSEVDCPNGGTDCSAIDHSACGSADKCECSAGYGEDKSDGSTCVKLRVSDVSCTSNGGTDCNSIAHSACGSSGKCECSKGFGEGLTDGSTCVQKVKVSAVTCTNGGTECRAIVNSACGSSGKCECSKGYGEDLTDGSTCVETVSSKTCTGSGDECDNVKNAVCDATTKKCKCSNGYVMNVSLCVAENAAATMRVGAATTLLYVILTVLQITGY